MWLALDIGNSAVKGGIFDGDHLAHVFRLAPADLDDGLAGVLRRFPVHRAGISSVVPARTPDAAAALRRHAGVEAEILAPTWPLPFEMRYETPHTLGMDRLAAAAAVWMRHVDAADRPHTGAVAIDAGTALTLEVIDRGAYLGGIIAPGPALMMASLSTGTAQLPLVPAELPGRVVGRSTTEALQAGVMFGFVEGLRGLLDRVRATLPPRVVVVATGGWAPLLAAQAPGIDAVEPHLVLHGVGALLALRRPEGP